MATTPDARAVERFGAALAALDGEIDWDRVAGVYCEGDAEGFFDEERRGAVLDAGLKLAADLGEVLRPGGRSLYVGAAVAELAPMLFEALVLDRKVVWVTLRSPESDELGRALGAASEPVGRALPTPRTSRWHGREVGPCDHVWMTSVLTDPDAFPALHDELYGRRGTPEAIGGGHPKEERRRARALVEEALEALDGDARLTTTDEELAFWRSAVEGAGASLEIARTGRTSGLVGDVIRFCRLRASGPRPRPRRGRR
ncbi:MAG: hypothetical protein AAGB93_17750 [Planctomycetota bacterium]